MIDSNDDPWPIERETFLRYRKSTPKQRLEWLEQLVELNERTNTPKIKKHRTLFQSPHPEN